MEIRFLADVEFSLIHRAFLNAFSDYLIPMQPSESQLRDLFERRGAVPELSVGAFDRGELVGFNWNALDHYNGVLAIYDVATGVVPSHRRKGIANRLFDFSLPKLKNTSARSYVLEVFEQNNRAIALYEKIGFRKIRTLECFRTSSLPARGTSPVHIGPVQPEWNTLSAFWDWQPSWQNSIGSIKRSKSPRTVLGAFHNGAIIGYGIIFPNAGDIPQLAVARNFRRQGAGTALLQKLMAFAQPGTAVRLINIDSSDHTTTEFLPHRGFERFITQLEMQLSW